MTAPINMALYRLLLKQGAEEAEAEQAAQWDAGNLVTKADLLELEIRLQRYILTTMLTTMLGMTAIFSFIVGLFRIFS
jgi:hypothetical protein